MTHSLSFFLPHTFPPSFVETREMMTMMMMIYSTILWLTWKWVFYILFFLIVYDSYNVVPLQGPSPLTKEKIVYFAAIHLLLVHHCKGFLVFSSCCVPRYGPEALSLPKNWTKCIICQNWAPSRFPNSHFNLRILGMNDGSRLPQMTLRRCRSFLRNRVSEIFSS